MNLIVDIGNSFIKLAIYESGELVFQKRHVKVLIKDIKKIRKRYVFDNAIVSSVRKNDFPFLRYIERNYGLHRLSHKSKVPITNNYGTPKTLGLDRLAVMVAAAKEYPGKNALVIDIGTCMTYDFIDSSGVYHGGNIAPGVQLRLKSMHHFTSALPLVEMEFNSEMLGSSTTTAIQNGAVWGIKLEIESFIKTLTTIRGKMVVILTGGDALYFGDHIDSKIFVHSNFLLKGLDAILENNL